MSSGASLVESLYRLGKFKEIAALLDKRADQFTELGNRRR